MTMCRALFFVSFLLIIAAGQEGVDALKYYQGQTNSSSLPPIGSATDCVPGYTAACIYSNDPETKTASRGCQSAPCIDYCHQQGRLAVSVWEWGGG